MDVSQSPQQTLTGVMLLLQPLTVVLLPQQLLQQLTVVLLLHQMEFRQGVVTLLRKILATKVQPISRVSTMVPSPISAPVPKSVLTLRGATFGLSPIVANAISSVQIMGGRTGEASHLDKSRVVDQSPTNIYDIYNLDSTMHLKLYDQCTSKWLSQ